MQTLQCRTVQLLSDQVHLFWLWCLTPTESASQENRRVDLWLQEFKLEACDDKLKASPCGEPVVVSKKEEPPSCLSSPLPVRHSPTTPTGQKDAEGDSLPYFGWGFNLPILMISFELRPIQLKCK